MKIKYNVVVSHEPYSSTPSRFEYVVNGSTIGELNQSQNFTEIAAKFRQIEFLSGKLSFYIINEGLGVRKTNEDAIIPVPSYAMIGMHTARTWFDEELNEQSEAVITKPSNFSSMWTVSAETPGYSVRLCNYITSGKGIQKLSFKAGKSSFKALKANPTGFQVNLPLSSDTLAIVPRNYMKAFVDITDITSFNNSDALNQTRILVSRTLLVRFKGAITH